MATREREKAAKRHEEAEKRPHGSARFIRMPASKVMPVIDLIRGKKVSEAKAILAVTPKAASEPVGKLLDSVIANAENNNEIPRDTLYVAEVFADQGPTLKRIRARAQGRASRINKRTCHRTIILDEIK